MATVIFTHNTMIGGTVFTNEPCIVGLQVGSFGSSATFTEVYLRVRSTDGTPRNYDLHTEVRPEGETLTLDISSQLRAIMYAFDDAHNPEKLSSPSTRMPAGTFELHAWTEWMIGGEHYSSEDWATVLRGGRCIDGGRSELDRLMHPGFTASDTALCKRLSRKPKTGEICAVGQVYPVSDFGVTASSVVTTRTVTLAAGPQTPFNQTSVYAVTPQMDDRILAFTNSLGVMETILCRGFESLQYEINSERFSMVGLPSYSPGANITGKTNAPRPTLRMSSGIVNRTWADWFATELLTVRKSWVLMDGKWIPCRIEPSDQNVTIYDRAGRKMPHIDFNVVLGVTGSVNTI